MKKIFSIILSALVATTALAIDKTTVTFKNKTFDMVEASDLTLIGKIMPTPHPYHRVDTVVYKGFTPSENFQVRSSAGIAVAFRTDSPDIFVHSVLSANKNSYNIVPLASSGYDLYIKKDGQWLWAGNGVQSQSKTEDSFRLLENMDGTMHECLVYMPLFNEVLSCGIMVRQGSTIEPIPSPFKHRIAVFGSSFTHGASCSRAGMPYPAQFTRHTGIQMLSLGCSGNCKLQPYFGAVLADVEADAYLFDSFSNPDAKMIEERLFPFIEQLVAAHPGKPLIFQQTIYRQRRNFDTVVENRHKAQMDMADSLMQIAVKKYPDVYFIHPNAKSELSEESVDGTHPDDYGYYLWARSIEKPVMKILRKYGIK